MCIRDRRKAMRLSEPTHIAYKTFDERAVHIDWLKVIHSASSWQGHRRMLRNTSHLKFSPMEPGLRYRSTSRRWPTGNCIPTPCVPETTQLVFLLCSLIRGRRLV